MKTLEQILAECKGEEDFKPHMMYDPKTGKGVKANTYADHVKYDKMGYTHEKPELKENYRTAARHGMGTEGKKEARVGLELDYYDRNGVKHMGKIVKKDSKGYTVKDDKTGKMHTFVYHDRIKAKKFLQTESRARRDAMRGMSADPDFQDKDSKDVRATDDDRKAASKNILMQIRKATDLPKGGELEFPSGKKGKISQADAKKVDRLFNMLKKPQDKAKFQKVISKDLNSIKGLLKRLGR
jgi:hypothetical protein